MPFLSAVRRLKSAGGAQTDGPAGPVEGDLFRLRLMAAITVAGVMSGCAAADAVRGRAPDVVLRFTGTPAALAACVHDAAAARAWTPPTRHVRDGVLRLSDLSGGFLYWEVSLRDDGRAEVRGYPTIWGGTQTDGAVALLNQCGAGV